MGLVLGWSSCRPEVRNHEPFLCFFTTEGRVRKHRKGKTMNRTRTKHRWPSAPFTFGLCLLVTAPGCFSEERRVVAKKTTVTASSVSGELFETARTRGLSTASTKAALETFVPTGGRDTYVGVFTTGSSGRLALVGVPSMRILKYVGIFTPEPWQGFAYDDESKALLESSARQDIKYAFGDSGRPAYSQSAGKADGESVFISDAANGRLGIVHLDDYEAKQVLANPVFRTSGPDLAVTSNTDFVLQATEAPEIPGGAWVDPAQGLEASLRGGLTLWAYKKGTGDHGGHLVASAAFTVGLPPFIQGELAASRGASADLALVIGRCAGKGVAFGGSDCTANTPSVLHVVRISKAKALVAGATRKFGAHAFIDINQAVMGGALSQVQLGAGATAISVSPDGTRAIVAYEAGNHVSVLDLAKLANLDSSVGTKDAFGVPTIALDKVLAGKVDVGGTAVDAVFSSNTLAFVSLLNPGKLVRIDVAAAAITSSLDLGVPGGRLVLSGAETAAPANDYVIVLNKRPQGRFVSVGPQPGLNPMLIDARGTTLTHIYDMSVPQATDLAGVLMPAKVNKTIVRYPLGTDTRSGEMSPFKTNAGKERIERDGNRVHVFGTIIRSHINPETVEVNEGDIVTFHLTNLEQAQDQTHGFTVDTYNVHGSWEPGKVASVTFVADKPGVFPYYCTEFCSALHLEMMGYMLVKPKNYKARKETIVDEPVVDLAEAQANYHKKMKTIKATQDVIDGVVAWLKEHKYDQDPQATALVTDAVQQLTANKEIQVKIDAAVAKKDWPNAFLWAEQFFQYQVKAADAGLRAKKILEEKENK